MMERAFDDRVNGPSDPTGETLTPADAAGLDALVESGFDPSAVAGHGSENARRVADLLSLLNVPARSGHVETMLDAVLARVRVHEQHRGPRNYALSGNDEDALESLIAADYDAGSVPAPLRRRARRQAELLALLEPARTEAGPTGSDLVARTLDRVQASIDAQERRLTIEPLAGGKSRRFALSDLVTVAAMLLIGTAAVWPMLGALRDQSRRLACQANLQTAGLGFANYAAEHRDALPMATVGRAGTPWWFVGKPEQSNSANLFTLSRTGYAKLDQLACAGNPNACRTDPEPDARDWRSLAEVSFSYQNLFGIGQPRLHGPTGPSRMVIAVDASPVVRRAIRGQWINPLENSMNHEGRGQNALFADGRVEWLTSPVLPGGEHIWLPHAIERRVYQRRLPTQAEPIKGTEIPAGADDVFVGP